MTHQEREKQGGAAFPINNNFYSEPGMTLRDYFAAKCDLNQYAPVDVFYRTYGRNPDASELASMISKIRYIEADAMLEART